MIKSITNFLLSNVSEQRIRLLIFSVGFTLTIWRSCECFQKYLHSNLSVRIDMVKNTDTFAPSLTICPEYFISYNETNMNKIGIQNANEYRLGNWYGNSTLDGGTIFKSVTHNFSDLVNNVTIHLEAGEEITFTKFDNLTIGLCRKGLCNFREMF